jgi:hypothetical protein
MALTINEAAAYTRAMRVPINRAWRSALTRVQQGPGTIRLRAEELVGAPVWSFWWD